jgi:hypothetical protein
MVGTIATLNAALRWDLSDFDRGTSHIEATFAGLRSMVGGVADAFAAAGRRMTLGVTVPLTALAGFAVKAAADAGELQSAFDYTFSAMAERMNTWAEQAGNALGRSTEAMQEGAMAFGLLFRQAAPTAAAAAELSQSFTELAQDASSFFNVPFDDAMQRIRSGLTGEAEPLRRFGVFLSEAKVEAKGLELGLIEVGQELNEEGKIMARAAVIAEELSVANGDLSRTGDQLANTSRSLKDEFAELTAEMGQKLIPVTETIVGGLRSLVQGVKDLPPALKDAALFFGALAAAVGPVLAVVTKLVTVALPLLLLRFAAMGSVMGYALVALTALINPMGAAIVLLGKLALEAFGARLALLGINLALGPIAIALTVLAAAWFAWSAATRQATEDLAAMRGQTEVTRAETERMLKVLHDAGVPIEGFGDGAKKAAGGVDVLTASMQFAINKTRELTRELRESGVLEIGAKLREVEDRRRDILAGQRAANQQFVAGTGMAGGASLIGRAGPGGADAEMLAELDAREQLLNLQLRAIAAARDNGIDLSGAGGGAGGYAAAEEGKTDRGARARMRSGPTEEELAARREEIALAQQLAVAQERGDTEAERSIERQLALKQRIEEYERAGLSAVQAKIGAERDMAEMDAARAVAREKALSDRRKDTEHQVAQLNNDFEHLRYLDAERDLERAILELRDQGYELAVAERIAQASLLQIEEARAENAARRLRDQERAHGIELARLRGEDTRWMEEAERARSRVDELIDGGRMSRGEAEAQALREGSDRARAHLQGTFRDTFRDGLRAALNGDLKGFFESWMRESSFNALSKVLDRLADSLANLIFDRDSGGGGGLLSALAGLFGGGSGFAGGDAAWAAASTPPGFDTGGSFRIRGFPGIDRNMLSLNGNPVARVSDGEIVDVRKGSEGGGTWRVVIEDTTGLFKTRVEQISSKEVAAAAPAIATAGSAGGQAGVYRRGERQLP